jgi:formylglycine-generating enzyme required for sulfatase activity
MQITSLSGSKFSAIQQAIQRAVRDFGDRARNAEIAFFYFSGHGMQSGGENYLIPIGAEINKESDLSIEAVGLSGLMRQIEEVSPRTAVVVLDACRDNPLSTGRKSGSKGLARVDITPSNTFIAFAAQSGATASDDGLYARELSRALKEARSLRDAFDRAGLAVSLASNSKQRPRKDDGLNADVRLNLSTDNDGTSPPPRPSAGGVPASAMVAGQTFRDCADCPEMVVIPAGRFTMGSPASEAGRSDDEGPQHSVNVKSIAMGKTHITRGQFAAFVNATRYDAGNECHTFEGGKWEQRAGRNWRNPGYPQTDNHLVVCINWNDAKAYTQWLSQKTGKNYRLPSEAEWEYAARAGTTTARFWGDNPDQACGYANLADETAKAQIPGASSWSVHNCTDGYAYTAAAASFKPNAFGLYDMIGNAWQWTEDCWHDNYNGAPD